MLSENCTLKKSRAVSLVGSKALLFRVRTLLVMVRESMVRDEVVAPTITWTVFSYRMKVRATLFWKSVSSWVLLVAEIPKSKVVEKDMVVVSAALRMRLRG